MRRLTEEERAQRVSKTQRKHEMHDLQELGERLAQIPVERLQRVLMPEALREALSDFRRMTKHEARRRQMQYIGRLMRGVDPEPIREALAAAEGRSARETARQHRLERLRSDLIESEETLARIAAEYPGADVQRLRQLRHSALLEHEQGKPPRAFRELFRVLRQIETAGAEETDGGADAESALDD